jgi:hypothetical protein
VQPVTEAYALPALISAEPAELAENRAFKARTSPAGAAGLVSHGSATAPARVEVSS